MTNTQIPAEAVDAAAKALYLTSGLKRVMRYEEARDYFQVDARELLEAAAPHVLADAWQRGNRAAVGRANPYRTAP